MAPVHALRPSRPRRPRKTCPCSNRFRDLHRAMYRALAGRKDRDGSCPVLPARVRWTCDFHGTRCITVRWGEETKYRHIYIVWRD